MKAIGKAGSRGFLFSSFFEFHAELLSNALELSIVNNWLSADRGGQIALSNDEIPSHPALLGHRNGPHMLRQG